MNDHLIFAGAHDSKDPGLLPRARGFQTQAFPARPAEKAILIRRPFPQEFLIFVVQFDFRPGDGAGVFQLRDPKQTIISRKFRGRGKVGQKDEGVIIFRLAPTGRVLHCQAEHAGLFVFL